MKAEIINGIMVIEGENEVETEKLKEWRKRKSDSKKRWLEVHYYNSVSVLVI